MQIPADRQRLIFRGKLLTNEDKIETHKIEDGSVLHLVANSTSNDPSAAENDAQNQQRVTATQVIAETAELAVISSLLRTLSKTLH